MYYPPICDQSFSVRDESGTPIDNAEVVAEKSVQTGFWRVTSTTTSDGGAVLTLDEGDTYTVTANKGGNVSSSKTFRPCIGRIELIIKETNMSVDIEFTNIPYAYCKGSYYSLGETIEEPAGTSVTIFCDIKRTDWLGTPVRGRLAVHWGGYIKCNSSWYSYGARDEVKNVTCNFTIPTSNASAAFYIDVEDDYVQHDPKCCIKLKPKAAPYLNITAANQNIPSAGGSGTTITVESNVSWTANADRTWIHIPSYDRYGSNNGFVSFTVDANTGSSRIGHITIAGGGISRICTINQAGFTPSMYVSPSSQNIPASGGSGTTITVETNTSWTVTKNKSWLHPSITSGSGNGFVPFTVDANTGTTSRTGTFTITGGGLSRTSTVTQLGVLCTCTSWQKGECINTTQRRQTRTCTPSGCDIEERIVSDPTCAAPPCVCDETWSPGECVSTTHRAYTRTCTPSGCDIEYEERPDSTCETAPPPPPCSNYIDEESCISAGCSWYDGACHEYAPVECSDYTDAITCEANLCYWWADGTCHDIEEPSPDKKNTEFCDFSIYDDDGDQRTLTINKQYTVAAKLCWVKSLGIGGCNVLHPSDCVEGYEVPGVKLQFKKVDGTEILETPVTNSDGWAGAFWTLIESDIGAYSVKLIFPGNADYNACESNEIEIDVKEPPIGLHIKSCTPTEFPNALYSGINPLSIETVVLNDTTETVEVKLKLTFMEGAKLCDEIPETYFKNISPGNSWTANLVLPTLRCTATYLEDMWARVELWEQYKGERTDSVDIKIGEPPEPNGEEGLFASLISMIMDALNISEPQAKLIVYGAGGLLALSFIMPMLRK